MDALKIFYRKTYYFWIVTRISIILLFSYVLINRPAANDFQSFAAQAIIALDILCMIICSIYDFVKRKVSKWVKYFIGSFSIIGGLILIYIVLSETNQKISTVYVVAIWLILYGIWEIINTKE
jgi:hypothetical protein